MNLRSIFIICTLFIQIGSTKAQSPITKESFKHINLNFQGLENVKNAVESGKYNDAASALLKYYRIKLGSRKPDFSNLEIPVDTTGSLDNKTFETAEKALQHQFKTQESYGFFDFGKDINWQLWPVKDNEVRWQLHRLKWWLPMALAYRSTKDEKYAQEWVLQFDDWVKKNPLGLSADNDRFAWRALEVSDRIQSLVPTISIFINSPHFTSQFLITVLNSYHQQTEYLRNHYAKEGNHRLFEAQRTLFAGASFPEFSDAVNWRKSGIDVLNSEIIKQVYADGVQYELSPVYHAAAIDIFAKAYKGAQKAGVEDEFPASYKLTVEKMAMAFINITFPNYNQPMFGDSWWTKKELRIRQFTAWSELFPENPFISYFASDGKKGQKPNWLSNALNNAGLYTFRNGWDRASTILIIKASPPGEFHAQPDNGTFELWVNGRNFTPDAGCFVYSGDAEIMKKRNWFRQTRVHSTMTLNNQDMVITKAQQNKWTTSTDLDVLTYTNPSYLDLNHRRTVLFVDKKYFIILDQAIGAKTGILGVHYQLKEDSKPQFDKTKNRVWTSYSDGNNLLVQCLSPIKTELKKEEGKVSYQYGTETTRPALVFEKNKDNKKDASFVSVMYPFTGGKAPKITLKENKGNNYAEGELDLVLTIDGKRRNLKLNLNN
ncbi:heparin-sulfate lyase HepC [Sphingobacterium sp. JUb56]|uniref:heparin-sulfate lyase HepC n=1 Tax=Sphingobacterium sp. JUb56 TaxID=2587145 RepID=UPI001612C150|nr:heparin-sulfate lyase HepC [Sphingobacterium sp. JUb56]MBB2952188.1 heparan-sulfate lyase [Sphingobacterium sp. JUb56]